MSRMHWHPKTGEMRVFEDDEKEPDGWLDTHPLNPALGGDGVATTDGAFKTAQQEKPMLRAEVVAALQQGGIQFDNKASAVFLHDLLRNSLLDALREREVQGIDDMTTRELLVAVEQ